MSARFLPGLPSCVLLDFDGTMYSYEEVYAPVWRRFFDSQGDAFGGADFQAVYDWTNTLFDSIPSGLDSNEQHEFVFNGIKRLWPAVSGPVEKLISDYRQLSLECMRPRSGLTDLLNSLDEHGVPWGIVSNHDGRNRQKLQAMDLGSQPAAFLLSDEVGVWKPDARIFSMATDEIGSARRQGTIDRDSAVMVGDSVGADIVGGKAAGLRTVLLSDGHYDHEDDGGADLVVGGFEDLRRSWFG